MLAAVGLGIREPRVGVPTIWEVGYQRWLLEEVISRGNYKGGMGVRQRW